MKKKFSVRRIFFLLQSLELYFAFFVQDLARVHYFICLSLFKYCQAMFLFKHCLANLAFFVQVLAHVCIIFHVYVTI